MYEHKQRLSVREREREREEESKGEMGREKERGRVLRRVAAKRNGSRVHKKWILGF